MNRQEKLNAILDRLKVKDLDFDGEHISAMVICGYLDDLSKLGLIESAYAVTETGSVVRAVCEEFDWKPDDGEILSFVTEMIEPQEQTAFMFMIKKYRDDREGLLADFKKATSNDESKS